VAPFGFSTNAFLNPWYFFRFFADLLLQPLADYRFFFTFTQLLFLPPCTLNIALFDHQGSLWLTIC
jgi:hypothetical protein